MIPLRHGVDLSDFAARHLVAAASTPEAMSEILSALYSPYQIRLISREETYDTSLSSTLVRSIRIGLLQTRRESVGKALDDTEAYSLTFVLGGQTRTWMPGHKEEISAVGEFGRIFQRRVGTVTIDGDETTCLNMWVPKSVIQATLQQMLGDGVERPVEFEPRIRNDGGAGGTLFRSMLMAASEMADPESSFAHASVAVRFEEFIAHTLFHGLRHNYSDLLTAQRSVAAPRCVIRALEYIKSHASDPLTIADIASASGSSTRALQLAFRAWRDTTPMKELTRIRLEYAHADLLKMGLECTVTQIAMKWGFGHPGRFAQQYAQVMGQSPSQTQRYGMSTQRPTLVPLRSVDPR